MLIFQYTVLKRERYEKNEWFKGEKWIEIAYNFVILRIDFVKMNRPEKKFYTEEELFQIRMNRTPEERYEILSVDSYEQNDQECHNYSHKKKLDGCF